MKKICILIVSILMSLSTIITGCITSLSDEDRDDLSYEYSMEIINHNSTEFFIYLPIPLYSSNQTIVKEIIRSIQINEGTCNYHIVDTPYGKALNVSSNGSFSLSSIGVIGYLDEFWEYVVVIYPSLEADYEEKKNAWRSELFWVYSSESNITLDFTLYVQKDSTTYSSFENTDIVIKGNWQSVILYEKIALS